MSDDSLMRQSILSTTSADSNCDATEIGDVLSSDEKILEDTVTDIDSLDNVRFSIWVSFAEIYNENVHDLLEPATQRRKTTKGRSILTLREDKTGTPYIKGLREIHVTSADEAYKLLTVGKRNLQVACTKLNRNSSRSHCIFTIKMLRVANKENPNAARMSMLSFCDLAGSERYSKTQSLGERIKEAGNINTSLLTLSRCIKILRHNQINKDHPQVVPFRESKLTRLFQSFFCGKGRASMVVNVNPCASTFDETLHVLNYSAIAKQVIVVQESEKSKKGQCIGRQFSLLLEQRCRDTIGWATPGTCAKVFQEEKDLQEEDSESEDEIEEIVSETETEKKLVELVKLLKNQLVQEKQKQLMIEARTREEVCKEVSEQLAQIEAYYG
ncbi:hypothetical protein LSH36_90g06031 [Paralvinella palmiformis]|uniref:Kinesin-like protein n=1 Tax=Paralvinella palmiformis TaxID=53620 RepID=A0AAD9NC78_9ANNE|nr:hypothetical protein LSH36_90g06031 [Paralvinella palmiformis]